MKAEVLRWIDINCGEVIERVRSSGAIDVDSEELNALRESFRAGVRVRATRPFNEAIASDRQLLGSMALARERVQQLDCKRAVFETRLNNARERTAYMAVPSTAVIQFGLAAVAVFALCFAPTILAVFFSSIEDAISAWAVSLAIGAAIGTFLTLLLLPSEVEFVGTKQSVWLGIGLGIGFGILRIAKADSGPDYLIAIGLTVLECVAVAGLSHFAENRRKAIHDYCMSRAQGSALEQAIESLDSQRREQQEAHSKLIVDLRNRELEDFDVERVAEEATWAVEAAYRSAINSNRRLLEGGAVEAMPMSKCVQALGFREAR